MEWPYYEPAQPWSAPPRPPGRAPIRRSPGYYPIQSFDRPDQPDYWAAYERLNSRPLDRPDQPDYPAAYELPISRPPEASRHHRHHDIAEEREYPNERRYRGHGQIQFGPPIRLEYPDHAPPGDEIFTDASLESDVSDALSANSFTFDGSILNIGEKKTDNEVEGEVYREGAVEDGGKGRWRWGDDFDAGWFGGGDGGDGGCGGDGGDGGGGGPTATTYPKVEIVRKGGRKTRKPSPYFSSSLTVLYSRFVGDVIPQWTYATADLSVVASEDLVRLKKEPLFRWVYVLVLLESSNAYVFRHLQGQHPNFSSLIVGPLPSLTVCGDKLSTCSCLCTRISCDGRSTDYATR